MKLRLGFVSNSSSASFAVALQDLTIKQVELIINHAKYWMEIVGSTDTLCGEGFYNEELVKANAWEINKTGNLLVGETVMNNLDMEQFMTKIGVDLSKVKFFYD